MESVEVYRVAYDVLDAALTAGSPDAAREPMRLELEVLSREDLVRVAMALAVESALVLTPAAQRPKFSERVARRRTTVEFRTIVDQLEERS